MHSLFRRKQLLFLFFLLVYFTIKSFSQEPDIVVKINESTVNKMIRAIGPVSDSGSHNVVICNVNYKWNLLDARIAFEPGKARFGANVSVHAGMINYNDFVEGEIKIDYRADTNKLFLTLQKAEFDIYTRILGKKFILSSVDLARWYKEPFVFDGPLAYQSSMDFEMPSGPMRTLTASIDKCKIDVVKGCILMNAWLIFKREK
ncbi:MAG: hypothetical protein V2A54_06990 [Bacteroidota bacterium]